MQKPLVSVIVPIYNAQNNIVRCVESIRRQTYENLEILLLNDGSKDVSYPVCEMLSKADARIVLIDKENSGVSATRNLGMRMARGKYLQFVDADDTLEPFATELLVQRAEDNNADLVIAAYNRIVPYKPKKEAKLDPLLPNKKKQLTEQLAKFQTFGFLPMGFMTKEEFACGLMQEPASFYYGVMWNKLYRADLVRAHSDVRCSEEMTWSEDLYFNLTYIRYAERFFALTTPIYNYYDNPGSAVHLTKVRTAITARTALFSYYQELYEQLGLYEENKLQIFKYLISSSEA
ncbi:glycosyltransferase family 2 protein [Hominenteromicrobium sp.]|uniref:glycosyltransferase family 2 protein n=1 Tax=Hominenteromicrobium sp. TaxID=3073581 RepID=UPI003AF13FD5